MPIRDGLNRNIGQVWTDHDRTRGGSPGEILGTCETPPEVEVWTALETTMVRAQAGAYGGPGEFSVPAI